MKKALPLSVLFILFISCVNTKERKQSEPTKETIEIPSSNPSKPKDFDPYFTPTETITTTKGPQNITRNILADRKGNIWLATWEGLIRYDGSTFTNITNQEGLRRYRAFDLLEDQKGHLWVATIGAGVYHYDGTTFTNYTTADGLANDRVTNLYEDRKGVIWFGTESGISQYNGSTFTNLTREQGLLNTDVNSIMEDRSGKFWIGTRGRAYWYDGQIFTEIITPSGKPFTNVRKIIKDRDGNMWLGGNDGLWRFDGIDFLNYTQNFIGYIYEDQKGNIWTSSEGAYRGEWVLSRYEVKPLNFEKAIASTIKTEENMFFGIVEDKAGLIWLGSLKGVYRYDGAEFSYFE